MCVFLFYCVICVKGAVKALVSADLKLAARAPRIFASCRAQLSDDAITDRGSFVIFAGVVHTYSL